MKHKPYTAKTIAGAQRRVRELQAALLEANCYAGTCMREIERLRRILRDECRLNPDGTPIGTGGKP